MYPKIKIDLVLIEGTFTPDMVRILSARFGVPLSFMFTQCPARDFPYPLLLRLLILSSHSFHNQLLWYYFSLDTVEDTTLGSLEEFAQS